MTTSRSRKRRSRPRSISTGVRFITRQELKLEWIMLGTTEAEYEEMASDRPKTRADCQHAQRPCPWVACKHHLYLDIGADTGSIKINFPDLEPWELKNTCALDVAERGGITLEEVGDVMNLTRERIRQVEYRGLLKMRASKPLKEE